MRTQNNLKQLGIGCHDDSFEFDLTSGDDADETILIGLLLPAVQSAREAAASGHSGGGNFLFCDGSVRVADDVIVDGRIITAEDWG